MLLDSWPDSEIDEQREIVSSLCLQVLGHEMSLAGSQLFSAKLLLLVREVLPAGTATLADPLLCNT